jgi:hypothetical protein
LLLKAIVIVLNNLILELANFQRKLGGAPEQVLNERL